MFSSTFVEISLSIVNQFDLVSYVHFIHNSKALIKRIDFMHNRVHYPIPNGFAVHTRSALVCVRVYAGINISNDIVSIHIFAALKCYCF